MLILPMLAFIILVISGMVILIFRDWRINASALGLQYLAGFVLVNLSWPIGMAVIKLIVGWMASSALAFTCMRQLRRKTEPEAASSLIFRGIMGFLTIIVIFIITTDIQQNIFPGVDLLILQAGLTIMGLSLMQLGSSGEPYLIIISLLSFLAGFEMIHAALEISTLLTGLLVVVNLGLALIGVYFINKNADRSENSFEEESQ